MTDRYVPNTVSYPHKIVGRVGGGGGAKSASIDRIKLRHRSGVPATVSCSVCHTAQTHHDDDDERGNVYTFKPADQ